MFTEQEDLKKPFSESSSIGVNTFTKEKSTSHEHP